MINPQQKEMMIFYFLFFVLASRVWSLRRYLSNMFQRIKANLRRLKFLCGRTLFSFLHFRSRSIPVSSTFTVTRIILAVGEFSAGGTAAPAAQQRTTADELSNRSRVFAGSFMARSRLVPENQGNAPAS
jgi:hypothetical protein